MIRRNLFIGFILFFFIILQTSFFTSEIWQNKINFILFFLSGLILYFSLSYSLVWLIFCGYLLDLNSHLNFGVITISMFISIIVIFLLNKKFIAFTTFWTRFLLIIICLVIFNLLVTIFSYFLWKINLNYFYNSFNLIDIFHQTISSLILYSLIYFCKNFVKKYLIFYE